MTKMTNKQQNDLIKRYRKAFYQANKELDAKNLKLKRIGKSLNISYFNNGKKVSHSVEFSTLEFMTYYLEDRARNPQNYQVFERADGKFGVEHNVHKQL